MVDSPRAKNAALKSIPQYGTFMDREKCFDRLPWDITFELEKSCGFPTQWTEADRRFNVELQSCFQFGKLVGPWWSATNAFRQGLASSVRRVLLLMGVWVRRQTRMLPAALVASFFDDCSVITDSAEDRQASLDESDKLDELTGQRLGHEKTCTFALLDGLAADPSATVALERVPR